MPCFGRNFHLTFPGSRAPDTLRLCPAAVGPRPVRPLRVLGTFVWLRSVRAADRAVCTPWPRQVRRPDEGAVRALFAGIASRDQVEVTKMLDQDTCLGPRLAPGRCEPPRSRRPTSFSRSGITSTRATPLCMSPPPPITEALAESLVERGAAVRARNRRGAEPLHYAADGGPGQGPRDSRSRQRD